MVLSGAGDALGYYNGRWEFCHSGETIHKELKAMGGLEKITVACKWWFRLLSASDSDFSFRFCRKTLLVRKFAIF